MRRAESWLGAGVTIAVFVVAALRTQPPHPDAGAAHTTQVEAVALPIVQREPGLRRRSLTQFPYDSWSQDDAFHAHEQNELRRAALRHGISVASAIAALDVYLRTHPMLRLKAGASPAKPRPFYD